MPTTKEEHDHLTHLSSAFSTFSRRAEQARKTAIGVADTGSGLAHDPALNGQIDWFYRRWVQNVEASRSSLKHLAALLTAARKVYEATDDQVRAAAGGQHGDPTVGNR